MPPILTQLSSFIGTLLRFVGFLVAGLALGRFVLDQFKSVAWQVQIALALGLFGLLIGLTAFSSAGSAGGFALGLGGAYFMTMMPRKTEDEGSKSSKGK
jgi:hypothetical protein